MPRHLLPLLPYTQHLPAITTSAGYPRPQQPTRPYAQPQPLPRSVRPHTPVVLSPQPDGSGGLRDYRTPRVPNRSSVRSPRVSSTRTPVSRGSTSSFCRKIAPRSQPYDSPNRQQNHCGGGPSVRDRKVADSPYYRPEKPWHRQMWQEEPDTPLNRHMDKVLAEKLVEHVTKINARNQKQELAQPQNQAQAQRQNQAQAQKNRELVPDSPSTICKWWLCEKCLEIPVQPITTTCGHALCRQCAERTGVCRCGTPVPDPLVPNCVIASLVETLVPQNPEQR